MRKKWNTSEAPRILSGQDLPSLPPLEMDWLAGEVRLSSRHCADARIGLHYKQHQHTFVLEYKHDWSSRTLAGAIKQAQQLAALTANDRPLVVLPYLSDEHQDKLLASDVSGIDLCGNALITGDHWLVRISGRPNLFRHPQPLKSPYRGRPALVGRMLLTQPDFPNAEQLRAAIEERGGRISQPVVSRTLKVLREDLIVQDDAGQRVRLLDPTRLLDRLAAQWEVKGKLLWRGKVNADPPEFLPNLFAAQSPSAELIMTGLGSAGRHTSLTLTPGAQLYAHRTDDVLQHLEATETNRFANLEIYQPPDNAVFFNPTVDAQGVRWASDVQAYLELQRGDSRLQTGASELRTAILKRAKRQGAPE